MDDDLERMSREQLIEEVKKLRDAIAEKTDPQPLVPSWPEFIRGCASDTGNLLTRSYQTAREATSRTRNEPEL